MARPAFDDWQEVSVELTLVAGANAIRLENVGDNGPNLDRLVVSRAGADDSADADGNLLLDGPTGALNETQAASINFNISGRDADIVKTEISFDGGASRIDVTDIVDADGDFVIDGSGLADGAQTATIIVTDAVGNEATATHNLIVGDLPEGEAQTFEEVVRINFEAPESGNGSFDAPAGYTTPEGFESDTGAAFGDRGNGFSYGWVDVDDATGAVTGTPAAQPTGSPRYKNAASEASDLQKTYIHFDYPGAPDGDRERAWEIALENGTYEVTVAIGDTAGQYDSTYLLNAEGQPFGPSWEPVNLDGQKLTGGAYDASYDGEGLRSYLYTGIVEVTDGRLTLDGTDGQNVEIQWLDIERVPDLTPDDGRPADLDYSRFVDAVAASTQNGQVSIEIGDNGSLPIDIDPTSSLVVGVQLQAADHRGPAVSSVDDIRLYETLTGIEVPINVQITGGADSLTIRPLEGLKEFTSYTLDIENVLDLGNLNDSSLPQRQFQDYSTSFVTGEAPEVEAREVAFVDSVVIDGFADGAAAFTSIEFGPDGKLYVSTITGEIHRWDVNSDGSLDKGSQETLSLDYFQTSGRSIIGITFDPEDPNTIWVTDNAPVPRDGKAANTPDFSGQVSKITLGANGAFEGAEAETYITGLPRSGGDHVTNSLEFRANPDADQPGAPNYLLYLTQGSNSAAGSPDNAWGFRPERLLNASVLEVDPRRDAPDGGFDVQTEPYDPGVNTPTYRTGEAFNDDGTFGDYYDPFAADAVLKIYGEGIRNAYDLVWHSNGFLYTPTNGTAAGGITPDDPTTSLNEQVTNMPKQYDYLFQVQEGGFYGHPNPLLDHYILNGGNPTSGDDPNSANTGSGGSGGYPFLVDPDPDYDLDGSYSLGFNKSPNGAIEYKGDLFGANLDGAILFAQFSVGDNVRVINVDPVTGRVTGDDVLRRPGGDVIDEYIDPLDIIENPATGQLYLMTLNRGTGESKIVLLNPAPGGVVSDNTADAGGDLGLVVVDASDPANVLFQVVGLDDDIQTITVSFDGAQAESVSLTGGQFTADLTGRTGEVTATLTVGDDDGNSASTSTSFTPGEDVGAGTVTIDALAFDVIDGDDGTIIRRIDDPSTYEEQGSNDANGDGLNDNYDGGGYLDPNGGVEDKAAFTYVAAAAGTYVFTFRMANGDGSGAARPIAIRAGDQTVAIDDTQTGSFTSWQDFPVTLTLEAGVNTIVIAQTSAAGGPNIDSVTVTPDEVADVTADEGGNLVLTILDASDPAAVVVSISGADSDLTSLVVTFSDGTNSVISTPSGNGSLEVDLSALDGDIVATLVVQDEESNTADVATNFTLGEAPVGNDGTETVNTVTYAIYEAENAELIGGPVIVSDTSDERGQRGGEFVDFDGTGDQSITWTVSVPAAGTYGIDILYALAGGKAPRPATLSVNGEEQGTLAFAPNSNDAETLWGPQSAQVELNAGTNTITMTVPEANGANIDYLRITQAPLDDLTADEGGDLALSVVDASDPNAVIFEVAGLDEDIVGLTVSFDGGAPQSVTLDGDDRFTADLGTYGEITATLTVFDGSTNRARCRDRCRSCAPQRQSGRGYRDPEPRSGLLRRPAAFLLDRQQQRLEPGPRLQGERGRGDRQQRQRDARIRRRDAVGSVRPRRPGPVRRPDPGRGRVDPGRGPLRQGRLQRRRQRPDRGLRGGARTSDQRCRGPGGDGRSRRLLAGARRGRLGTQHQRGLEDLRLRQRDRGAVAAGRRAGRRARLLRRLSSGRRDRGALVLLAARRRGDGGALHPARGLSWRRRRHPRHPRAGRQERRRDLLEPCRRQQPEHPAGEGQRRFRHGALHQRHDPRQLGGQRHLRLRGGEPVDRSDAEPHRIGSAEPGRTRRALSRLHGRRQRRRLRPRGQLRVRRLHGADVPGRGRRGRGHRERLPRRHGLYRDQLRL